MKKGLSLLLTVIFVMSLSVSAFANSTSGELSVNEVKSAEQSVLDFFAAVQNNDYDTLNRVSVDKHMSDEVRRNTLELQHEEAVIAEKPTILSSEKCSEDMVMVKVSYVMAGKERIMTYPVVLVNNEWIVNVGDAVDPSVVVLWESIVPVTDNSKITRQDWTYDQTLNVGRWYLPFYITHSALVAYIQGWQNNPNGSVNVSYGIYPSERLSPYGSCWEWR